MRLTAAGYVIIAALAIAAAYFFASNAPAQGGFSEVQNIYELLTGNDVEVVKTEEISGLTRVTLRVNVSGEAQLQDVFVTKDGKLLAEALINITAFRSQLEAEKAFAECLDAAGVRILGLPDDRNTQAQLAVLGRFSGRLFINCAGDNAQLCQAAGVTTAPAIFYNGTLTQGPLGASAFETTGCTAPQ